MKISNDIKFINTVKEKQKIKDYFFTYLSDEKFKQHFKNFASQQDLPKKEGVGIEVDSFKKSINSTFKLLEKKSRKNNLRESEKWFFDNFHIFQKNLARKSYDKFYMLPHLKKQPRVVKFAREFLKNSNFELSNDRLKLAVKLQNEYQNLTYDEICHMEDALCYVLLEKMSSIAIKIKILNILENLAKCHSKEKILMQSNVYRVFIAKEKGFDLANKTKYNDFVVFVDILRSIKLVVRSLHSLSDINIWEEYPPLRKLKNDYTFSNMSLVSKHEYLSQIEILASSMNIREVDLAEKLLEYQNETSNHFGKLLFAPKHKVKAYIFKNEIPTIMNIETIKQNFFVAFSFLQSVVLSIGLAFLTVFGLENLFFFDEIQTIVSMVFLPILFYSPVLQLSNKIINWVFSFFILDKPVLKMDFDNVSENAKTLVVVSKFFESDKHIKKFSKHIKSLISQNSMQNVEFVVLADTPKSDVEHSDKDKQIEDAIKKEGFPCLIRKKTKVGNIYQAKERKRGAVETLCESLWNNNFDAFLPNNLNLFKPKYIVVLDEDSVIEPNGILDAINSFLHPMNENYDILSFKTKLNLFSLKTIYSEKFLDEGSRDIYQNYCDLHFNMFGRSLFCGKGIFKLSSYVEKCCNKMPENRVLSHDIIEGGFMKCGKISTEIFEDAPQDFESEFSREIRWQRGDLQNIPFLFSKKLDSFTKYMVFSNAVKIFKYISLLVLFMWAGFEINYAIFTVVIFLYATPYLIDIIQILLQLGSNRLTIILQKLVLSIGQMTLFLAMIAFFAINDFFLMFKMFVKFLARKNMLEWKIFSSKVRNKKYVLIFLPAFTFLFGTTLGAFFFNKTLFSLFLARLISYMFLVYQSIRTSKKHISRKKISKTNKKYLQEVCQKIYQYFLDNETNGLIADNLQNKNHFGKSIYTSPTNIGFSLLAHICATYFGFVSKEEAETKIKNTISTVEKLEKWHGNLFNWYNVNTEKCLYPFFVSSVDSGNFVASLLVAKTFVDDKKLKSQIEKIIDETDLSVFYDKKKEQFFIGYNKLHNKFEGHYDILTSEARTLVFLHSCFSKDNTAWNKLSRSYNLAGAMLSWNGTTFEYMLPEIFMMSPAGSNLEFTNKIQSWLQFLNREKNMFGTSESGYANFDDSRHYDYKAFGINSMALRSEHEKGILSPYSSFLLLPYLKNHAVKNLKKMESNNCLSDYGFFEAMDFYHIDSNGSKQKECVLVEEFMAHHLGMSLCSTVNFLYDGAIQNLFEQDERVFGSRILLSETKYQGIGNKKVRVKKIKYKEKNSPIFEYHKELDSRDNFNVLGKEFLTLIGEYGDGYSISKNTMLNRFRFFGNKPYGSFFYICENKKVFSPTFYPLKNKEKFSYLSQKNCSIFCNENRNVRMEVLSPSNFDADIRILEIDNSLPKSDKNGNRELDIFYYNELCLNSFEADFAHRVFSNMMVSTWFDKERNIIFSKRKHNDSVLFSAMVVVGADIVPITSRFNFVGRNKTVEMPLAVENALNNIQNDSIVGDVLEPCYGFQAKISIEPYSKKKIFVATIMNEDMKKIEARIWEILQPNFLDVSKTMIMHEEVCVTYNAEKYLNHLVTKVLSSEIDSDVLEQQYKLKSSFDNKNIDSYKCNFEELNKMLVESLNFSLIWWKYEGSFKELEELAYIFKKLEQLGLKIKLVACYEENDSYFEDVKKTLQAELKSNNVIYACNFHDIWKEFCVEAVPNNLAVKKTIGEISMPKFKLELPSIQTDIKSNFKGKFFIQNGKDTPKLPFSNVMCLERGGSVLTENGSAFSFFKSSSYGKLTNFENDPVENGCSEQLFAMTENWFANLTKQANSIYKAGQHVYNFKSQNLDVSIVETMILNGGVKCIEVNVSRLEEKISLVLKMDLLLGSNGKIKTIYPTNLHNAGCFENLENGQKLFVRAFDGRIYDNDTKYFDCDFKKPVLMQLERPKKDICPMAEIFVEEEGKYMFLIGGDDQILTIEKKNIVTEIFYSLEFWKALPKYEIETQDKDLDLFFNYYLPYQIVSSRFYGRCGFYQTGGAIGFRDQLQDCLSVMKMDAKIARKMIVECAKHQYEEGDVMHWWHSNGYGVRTRISDDKLFLPFVASRYMRYTGDYELLKEKIPYSKSSLLQDYEHDRYEKPEIGKSETLFEHIKKAIKSSEKYGENGMLLIGGGDWNDALNNVGTQEKGESVWLSMFYCLVLEETINLFDESEKIEINKKISDMKKAVMKTYEGDRFKRLITKDGKWLGSKMEDCSGDNNNNFKIDLLTQSFAEFSDIGNKQESDKALETAWDLLVDEKHQIVKLLTPAVGSGLGYISNYPKGVRENGGQYTHSAVWFAMALMKANKFEKAYEVMKILNPISKFHNKETFERYKGEPFVLAGDVYSSKQFPGRAGWTWYTGAASWYYNAVLYMFGIQIENNKLFLDIKLPDKLKDSKIKIKRKNSTVQISYKCGEKNEIIINGLKVKNVEGIVLDEKKDLVIEIFYKSKQKQK